MLELMIRWDDREFGNRVDNVWRCCLALTYISMARKHGNVYGRVEL